MSVTSRNGKMLPDYSTKGLEATPGQFHGQFMQGMHLG